MRKLLTTVAEVAGMAAISVGFGLIWLPLGVISAGIALVVIGVAVG